MWDALSGQQLANASYNGFEKAIITRNTPAYWKYTGMYAKNLLTVSTKQENYLTDVDRADALQGLLDYDWDIDDIRSASISTWSNEFDLDADGTIDADENTVWHLNDTYAYNRQLDHSDGQTDVDVFDPWGTGTNSNNTDEAHTAASQSTPWQMSSNITRYNWYSSPIEEKMPDNTFNAVIVDPTTNLIAATASNTSLDHVYYTGFEEGDDHLFDNWTPAAIASDRQPHVIEDAKTGHYGVAVYLEYGTNQDIHRSLGEFEGPQAFEISVWFKGVPGQEGQIYVGDNNETHGPRNEFGATKMLPANGEWQLLCDTLEIGKTEVLDVFLYCYKQWGAIKHVVYDDLRIRPLESSLTTFTYDSLSHMLTSFTDPRNVSSYFEYDDFGRLVSTWNDDKDILTAVEYRHGSFNIVASPSSSIKCQQANFTNEVNDLAYEVDRFRWTFEHNTNGSIPETAYGQSVDHIFREDGTYTVILDALDINDKVIGTRTMQYSVADDPHVSCNN